MWILCYEVVELAYALGLVVVVVARICHVSIPQGVVGKDIASWVQNVKYHLVGFEVGAFVTVDECHVEHDA